MNLSVSLSTPQSVMQPIYVLDSHDGIVKEKPALKVTEDRAYVLEVRPLSHNASAGRSLFSAMKVERILNTDVFEETAGVVVKEYSKFVQRSGAEEEFLAWKLLQTCTYSAADILMPIDNIIEDDSKYYAILPAYKKGDVFDGHIVAESPMNELQAKHFARWLFGLLAKLQSTLNFAHGDISLENILRGDDEDSFVLIDFDGFHQVNNSDDSLVSLDKGTGKYRYMAPELFTEKLYNPFAADIWAAGSCVFMAMTLTSFVTMANNADPYFRALLSGGYENVLHGFTTLSDESIKFFMDVMQPDFTVRLSAVEILNHPWLKE